MRGRVLVLAGTAEARALLARCGGLDVEASLAGDTQTPDLPAPVRIGGFGGEAGFRAALPGYAAIVDATHPFAQRITTRTARICAETETPYLRLTRAPWSVEAGWTRYADETSCAAALPSGGRIFLATGPKRLDPFLKRGLRLWCRRIDPAPPQPGVAWIIGKPGDETAETRLLRDFGITDMVTRNSGGAGTGKLRAAKALGIKVHLIDRPNDPGQGPQTHDIDAALAFVRAHADHHL